MKTLLALIIVLAAVPAAAHPPVSVVVDRQGNAYYSDLEQVWKVAPNGTKSVAVANVHTHELYLDAHGNLFGEHLWYEGERTDKWGHYVWRRSPDGRVVKVIADRQGFPSDYSFARDAAGNQYIANREKGWIEKRAPNGTVSIVARELKGMSWLIASTPDATLYVVDGGDLVRVTPNGRVTRLARNVGRTTLLRPQVSARHMVMGLWTDRAGNVYAASYGEGKVKKVTPEGKVSVAAESTAPWSPVGGAFAPNGDLLLLECSITNQVRLRRIAMRGR
jgi:hypothetical protein